jgi:hypothetical protein
MAISPIVITFAAIAPKAKKSFMVSKDIWLLLG